MKRKSYTENNSTQLNVSCGTYMREARAIRKAIVAMQTSDVQSYIPQTIGIAKGSNTTES